jgi:hypothetical protein
MTAHDERDVETVAEVFDEFLFRMHGIISPCDHEPEARAVLDALDLPARERRAKAEMLRDAEAEARAASNDRGMGVVARIAMRVTADWLASLLAAQFDPEEKP